MLITLRNSDTVTSQVSSDNKMPFALFALVGYNSATPPPPLSSTFSFPFFGVNSRTLWDALYTGGTMYPISGPLESVASCLICADVRHSDDS